MSKLVVIVEDDADILDMMRYILNEEGYTVVCYDRASNVAQLTAHQPAVILLDHWLITATGNSFCSEIKNDAATRNIPVVLVSAVQNLEQIAQKCHADAFLAKPFNLSDLVNIVNRHAGEIPAYS